MIAFTETRDIPGAMIAVLWSDFEETVGDWGSSRGGTESRELLSKSQIWPK